MSPLNPYSQPVPALGPALQQFVLEKTKLGMRLPVDAYLIQTMRVDTHEVYESMFHDMVLQLEAFVLQDKLPPQTVREVKQITTPPRPATWWDHLKADKLAADKWYWGWLKKLKPPLYTAESKEITLEVNLDRWISYPEAQNIPETFGNRYRGYKIETNIWETSW